MKFALTTLTLASSSLVEDDVVMLSVASARQSAGATMSLLDFARAESPTKAAGLLQAFAASTVARGEAVDDSTKTKLKEIGAELTNRTWVSLEQDHRRDQDLLNTQWDLILACGDTREAHLRQDIDSLEVQQVRVHESDMLRCRGLPDHKKPTVFSTGLLQGVGDDQQNITDWHAGKDGAEWERLEASSTVKSGAHLGWGMVLDDDGNAQRYFSHSSAAMYDDGGTHSTSLLELKNAACKACGDLDAFIEKMSREKPNCWQQPVPKRSTPQATTEELSVIDENLENLFSNLETFSEDNLELWETKFAACQAARQAYTKQDAHCDEEQSQYEAAFCAYRQGLHSTCSTYQGCHIMEEKAYKDLIADVLYKADSRKIDWKAIHKIACYIKVLISEGTNDERTNALESCESGDLNTLATILTGFNETNYLSVIVPEISQNVSCWDMEVMPLIDLKQCDMSSVANYPCSEKWTDRYLGLESPRECTACPALPDGLQYSPEQETKNVLEDSYGGGWVFVNEAQRSENDITDVALIEPGSYYLPSYNMKGLRWNEVMVQRMSSNWCDSWGRQSSRWVQQDGASMCVQTDEEYVYCTNNHDSLESDTKWNNNDMGSDPQRWRRQPVSHFGAICSKEGEGERQGLCECWPHEVNQTVDNLLSGLVQEKLCFRHARGHDLTDVPHDSPAHQNVHANPHQAKISSLENDGSVVKIVFGEEKGGNPDKPGKLRVGNYGSFLDGVGCGASGPVQYRVFVRCMGCTTMRETFHAKDGAQFIAPMKMGRALTTPRMASYTFEAWFRSPLDGTHDREIFGGTASGGFYLKNVAREHKPCKNWDESNNELTTYRVTAGGANVESNFCFQKDLFYHVAVTRCSHQGVKIYVNGHLSSEGHVEDDDWQKKSTQSHLSTSFGGGFTDGGQLFNVRIWNYARSSDQLIQNAFVTDEDQISDKDLLHWWPLTENVKDTETKSRLKFQNDDEAEVRYATIWCSDLEATGQRGC